MAINVEEIRWADNNVNDPITGAPNKVAPTSGIKNSGLDRNEPLARAYVNYQFDKYHEMFGDLQAQINALAVSAGTTLLQQIFHVGSYYLSSDSQSPATRFGFGTWERVNGRVLVGVDESNSNFDVPTKRGGSINHSHTNNLTVNAAGEHAHTVSRDGWGNQQASNNALQEPSIAGRLVTGSGRSENNEDLESLAHAANDLSTSSTGSHTHTLSGGINAASNLMPFEAAYIWRRTA